MVWWTLPLRHNYGLEDDVMVRRQYSREFKLGAVDLVVGGARTVPEVAAELGLDTRMLYRWVREFTAAQQQDAFPGGGSLSPEQAELARLRRKLKQAEMERDILKKVLTAFGSPRR
jgi:transposase